MISKKIPPDKIFPRSYMDFEQKYQKDPGMNRVKGPQKKKKRLKYNRGKRWEGREGGTVGQKESRRCNSRCHNKRSCANVDAFIG